LSHACRKCDDWNALSWCGYLQEIIPFPREDGSVLFVDVIGEAS